MKKEKFLKIKKWGNKYKRKWWFFALFICIVPIFLISLLIFILSIIFIYANPSFWITWTVLSIFTLIFMMCIYIFEYKIIKYIYK